MGKLTQNSAAEFMGHERYWRDLRTSIAYYRQMVTYLHVMHTRRTMPVPAQLDRRREQLSSAMRV